MAYITGEAANYLNLLEVLRDFLTTDESLVADGQQWTQIGGSTGALASGDFVSLRGPGLGGTDQILMSLDSVTNVAAGQYNLRLRGHTAYNEDNPTVSPPGLNSPVVNMPLVNAPIRYWIVASGRRFILVAKSNNRYDVMYGGFVLPRHLPSDWPYPLLIAGSSPSSAVSSSDAYNHTNPWRSAETSFLFTPQQLWRPLKNIVSSGSNNNNGADNSPTQGDLICAEWSTNMGVSAFARTLDGQPWLQQGSLAQFGTSGVEARNFLGHFDGIYFTPAAGATVESTIEYDGGQYLVVPNVYRNSDGQMAAIHLE